MEILKNLSNKEISSIIRNNSSEEEWNEIIRVYNIIPGVQKNFREYITGVFNRIFVNGMPDLESTKVVNEASTKNEKIEKEIKQEIKEEKIEEENNVLDIIQSKIEEIPKAKGVYVGIGRGQRFFNLLHNNQDLFLYGVDPYKIYNTNDKAYDLNKDEWDDLYNFININAKKYTGRYKIYRKVSSYVSNLFVKQNKKFDFVIIDSDPNLIIDDIDLWYNLVSEGGYLFGTYNKDTKNLIEYNIDTRYNTTIIFEDNGIWWIQI